MMNVEELENKIKEEQKKLADLENTHEKEEDIAKAQKIEYRISRLDENIDKFVERQQGLLDREAADEQKDEPKDKDAEEEDTDVCSECGGDLIFYEKSDEGDIYVCEKCGEMFLDG